MGCVVEGSFRPTLLNGQIWVDADACPKVIKEILFRGADRMAFVNQLDRYLTGTRAGDEPDS